MPIQTANAWTIETVTATVRLVTINNHAFPDGTWWSHADAGRDAFTYMESIFPTWVDFSVTMYWQSANQYNFDSWSQFLDWMWEYDDYYGDVDAQGRTGWKTMFIVSASTDPSGYPAPWGQSSGHFNTYNWSCWIRQNHSGTHHSTIPFIYHCAKHELGHGMGTHGVPYHCYGWHLWHWLGLYHCLNGEGTGYLWEHDTTSPMECDNDFCAGCKADIIDTSRTDPFVS